MKPSHTKRLVVIGLTVVALVGILGIPSQGQNKKNPLREIMKAKLSNAQAALAGLATEDFAAIEKHALTMASLAKAAAWNVSKDTAPVARFSVDTLDLTSTGKPARKSVSRT